MASFWRSINACLSKMKFLSFFPRCLDFSTVLFSENETKGLHDCCDMDRILCFIIRREANFRGSENSDEEKDEIIPFSLFTISLFFYDMASSVLFLYFFSDLLGNRWACMIVIIVIFSADFSNAIFLKTWVIVLLPNAAAMLPLENSRLPLPFVMPPERGT